MKKYLLITLLLTVTVNCLLSGQEPAVQWQAGIGGSEYDYVVSIVQTSDGGYFIGGYSESPADGDKTEGLIGGYDYWVVKINSAGVIQWQNAIGGSDNDYMSQVQQTSDGGYILGGYSNSPVSGDKTEGVIGGGATYYDYWIVKLNASGVIEWDNTIGGTDYDYLRSIIQTPDGGYMVAGYSLSPISGDKTEGSLGGDDYWIVKLDASGSIVWQNTIGGTGTDRLYSVEATTDGGYILGGYSSSPVSGDKTDYVSSTDYWMVKIDGSGNIEWQNAIGGPVSDFLLKIHQLADGGYILGGYTTSNAGFDKSENMVEGSYKDDMWIVRTDATGTIVAENTIGSEDFDKFRDIEPTTDGGFIVIGELYGSFYGISGDKNEEGNNATDYWVMKLDAGLNIMWQNVFGGDSDDHVRSVIATADNGYLVGGDSQSGTSGDKTVVTHPVGASNNYDFWLVKFASDNCVPDQYYVDYDRDLFGVDGFSYPACEPAFSFINNNTDCDDNLHFVNPSEPEMCNEFDDNCDGNIDEGPIDCSVAPPILTQNDIGGSAMDDLTDINATADGGFIVVGNSQSEVSGDKTNAQIGGNDFWVLKLDAGLNISWQKTIGTIKEEYAAEIKPVADGGYILGGYVDINNVNYEEYKIYKLNATGSTQWQTTLGGIADDELTSIIQCTDGGYLVGGFSKSGINGTKTSTAYGANDYWVVKLSSTGSVLWQKSYGGISDDYLYSIIEAPDGGFYLGGYSLSGSSGNKTVASFGNTDYWLIKTDASGNVQWQKAYGGSSHDHLKDIKLMEDGSIILCGDSRSPISGNKTSGTMGGTDEDYWIIKTDNTGNIIWQQTIGGDFVDEAMEAELTNDGGIYITGHSTSWLPGPKVETYIEDYWVLKLTDAGIVEWQKLIGGDQSDECKGFCISPAGNLTIGGKTFSGVSGNKTEPLVGSQDYWIVKLDIDCVASTEICNAIDDDCDGLVDDGITETISISAGGATTFCQGGSVLLTAIYSGTTVQWKKNGVNIAGATSSTYSATKSGTYTCETSSICDTELSNSIAVTVNKNPAASISAGGATTFCAGGSVTLTETPVGGSTYQWYKGANPIAGQTTTSYIATTAGNYKCRVTKTATGCYKNSNAITVTVPCKEGEANANNPITNNEITIFPNPNTGIFTITANGSPLSAESEATARGARGVSIEIYDSLGQLIYSEQIGPATEINEAIDLGNISSGIYIIRINDGVSSTEQKLIIE